MDIKELKDLVDIIKMGILIKNGISDKNKRQGESLSFIFINIITFILKGNSVK